MNCIGAFTACSYSAINGTAACGSVWLNVDVVRNHWNWSGVIESDCNAVNNPYMCGPSPAAMKRCSTAVARAAQGLQATVDMGCQAPYGDLPAAVNQSVGGATIAQMRQSVASPLPPVSPVSSAHSR